MRESLLCLPETEHTCGYFRCLSARTEQYLAMDYSPGELNLWLELGYRHFGPYFFRPVCERCHRCVPIRVPVASYRPSSSAKRLLSKNRELTVKFEQLRPSEETFALYTRHKSRFEDSDPGSYEAYVESFFSESPCSGSVCVYDGSKLVSVSHIDMTGSVLSAVYCYYDPAFPKASLGSYSLLVELKAAKIHGLDYVYLGYYIEDNRHMRYKKRFYPNEALLTEGEWALFTDNENVCREPRVAAEGFKPRGRICHES